MKEIFDSLGSRIRSPILGSAVFFFVLINWKPLFFMVFSNTSVLERFQYFEDNTSIVALLVYPSLLGIAYAFIAPWASLLGTHIANAPQTKRRLVQIRSDQEVARHKQELEDAYRDLVGSREEALIERAKRDEKISTEISDPNIRERIEMELAELRRRFDEISIRPENPKRNDNVADIRTHVELLRQQAMVAKERGNLDEAEYLLVQAQRLSEEIGAG